MPPEGQVDVFGKLIWTHAKADILKSMVSARRPTQWCGAQHRVKGRHATADRSKATINLAIVGNNPSKMAKKVLGIRQTDLDALGDSNGNGSFAPLYLSGTLPPAPEISPLLYHGERGMDPLKGKRTV
ncbi:hypothetical protein FRC04_010335 [Tulasnella sp. 424]|nr:hypothetical protein FRC04_010335 [Tulasnella sp. 424]